MQGIVIDEEGKYVKAAIVKMFKMVDLPDDLDSDAEAEAVTYASTDENGRFVIRNLDPDENYTIEILVEEAAVKVSDASVETDRQSAKDDFSEIANMEEEVDFIEADSADRAVDFVQTDSTGETFIFIQNEELTGTYFTCGLKPETELKEKLYTIRNYTW